MDDIKLETRFVKKYSRWFSYDAWRWVRVVEWTIRIKVFRQPSYLIDRWIVTEDGLKRDDDR